MFDLRTTDRGHYRVLERQDPASKLKIGSVPRIVQASVFYMYFEVRGSPGGGGDLIGSLVPSFWKSSSCYRSLNILEVYTVDGHHLVSELNDAISL